MTNVKLLVATEKDDSMTFRFTPSKIGSLLAKVQPRDIPDLIESLRYEQMYMPRDKLLEQNEALLGLVRLGFSRKADDLADRATDELVIANHLTENGIDFVVVPVASEDRRATLITEGARLLESLDKLL